MQKVSLNGAWQMWAVQQPAATWPASVPGCVHTDLLAAEQIPDPFYRDQELDVQWVGETDWVYERPFLVSADLLSHEHVLLRCHGLDTLATIVINGQEVARSDNMFRMWEWNVKSYLQPGENQITITFASAYNYGMERLTERYIHSWSTHSHKLPGGNYVRKMQCNFGWDWGPKVVTCGIWRDIELVAYNTSRLTDVHLTQTHQDGAVTVTGHMTVEASDKSLMAQVQIALGDDVIAETAVSLTHTGHFMLDIPRPQLWWPNGMGQQPLYTVTVSLSQDDTELDQWQKRIGLRTLRLVRDLDQWGESFHFNCNGVPFFAKGANWIPADAFVTRLTDARYAELLQSAAAANMNMLRVWGGGIYEQDIFYDLCDELGLCIWQDFMFACATYPSFDETFVASVAGEARDNIRRLRHHASLALWCGNNELEQGLVDDEWTNTTMSWLDYGRLFDHLLPELVAELDPQTSYWPGSPHSPMGNRRNWNNPRSGDAHIWDVWHGLQPFEFYRTCHHRFNSEFGFQSFPEPQTCTAVTLPEDRNITSVVMEHHQRSDNGNSRIIHYMLEWFRMPTSFENTLWLSQILQGMAMKYAVEHWRRSMPRGMGTLYWQINDCWPVASWSSIDYYGRWKALHYMARRFFANDLISGVENLNTGTVQIHLTSDRLEERLAQVSWQLVTAAGEDVANGLFAATIPANGNQLVETLDVKTHLQAKGKQDLLLWLNLEEDGDVIATDLVLFNRPKHLGLQPPQLQTRLRTAADGAQTVEVTAAAPALWVWLEHPEANGRFSDNFFHLLPHQPLTLTWLGETPLSEADIKIHSLVDTFA